MPSRMDPDFRTKMQEASQEYKALSLADRKALEEIAFAARKAAHSGQSQVIRKTRVAIKRITNQRAKPLEEFEQNALAVCDDSEKTAMAVLKGTDHNALVLQCPVAQQLTMCNPQNLEAGFEVMDGHLAFRPFTLPSQFGCGRPVPVQISTAVPTSRTLFAADTSSASMFVAWQMCRKQQLVSEPLACLGGCMF